MKLLNAEQVAEILNIRLHRVYELARLDAIPVVRLGRQMRFDENALHEWIKSGGTRCPREDDEPTPTVRLRATRPSVAGSRF